MVGTIVLVEMAQRPLKTDFLSKYNVTIAGENFDFWDDIIYIYIVCDSFRMVYCYVNFKPYMNR